MDTIAKVVAALMLALSINAANGARPLSISVGDARTLSTSQLATELLGPRLGSRVIEMVRHEYDSEDPTPQSVDFYMQPELSYPRLNGICRVDIITVEYDWYEQKHVTPLSELSINHVEATSRYKAFAMPAGEPGTSQNEAAQLAACANMKTSLDAFRAPDAGDAQWLAAIEREYTQESLTTRIRYACDDFADKTCATATKILPKLALRLANEVQNVSCPKNRTNDQVNYCYRIAFPYPNSEEPEWVLTVVAGMRDGFAPVEIRALTIMHEKRVFGIP